MIALRKNPRGRLFDGAVLVAPVPRYGKPKRDKAVADWEGDFFGIFAELADELPFVAHKFLLSY